MCFKLRIQFGHFLEKIQVTPQSARGGGFGIVDWLSCTSSASVGFFCSVWIHEFAVGFLVPPGVTEIRIHEEISLVHVAGHALAGRNRARELMGDRMAALVFRNRFIDGEAETLVAVFAIPAGIRWRTVVRINDVARRATAGAIIARMIVRAHEIRAADRSAVFFAD